MNPYSNQSPYGFQQQAPGPPQPPWQAPPRRQGWVDPRPSGQPQSPVSPAFPPPPASNAFGPPLGPAQQQPPQFDTSQWGVRYNQGIGGHGTLDEIRPPLPPRPVSAAGRVSPQPPAHDYSYQQQPPPQQPYTYWNNTYQSTDVPPPPPPRPAEYQNQIQAAYQDRTSTPHQEYSHQPPSHHYDPQHQQIYNWQPQQPQANAPSYLPTAPLPQQLSSTTNGPLVSPIEPHNNYWVSQPAQQNVVHTQPNIPPQKPFEQYGHSQALSFGGPSDWEHYNPNGPPPDQTPTSPPANSLYQPQGAVSPPSAHATPAPTHQTPAAEPIRPSYAVEIGGPSPITPRRNSQAHASSSSRPTDHERRSTVDQVPSEVSVRSDSYGRSGTIDNVIQAWNAPLRPRPAQESGVRPGSAPRTTSPEPISAAAPTKTLDPYADLEPEFKASLKRYAAMLRREAAAETDDEKFDIFQTFVTKELRVRRLLYGVDMQEKVAKEVKKAASLADIQAMLPQSALPAAGPNYDAAEIREMVRKASVPVSSVFPAQTTQPLASIMTGTAGQASGRQGDQTNPQSSTPAPPADVAQQLPARPAADTRSKSREDGYVMVAAPGEDAYSPGGRPLMTKLEANASEEAYSPGGRPIQNVIATIRPPIDTGAKATSQPRAILSPSNDAPMVMEDYVMAQPSSPSINAPIAVDQEKITSQPSPQPSQDTSKPTVPIKFEPPRPAYTPFRYNAGVQEEKNKQLEPADQAYSSLRNSQADSGRLLVQDAALLAPARPTSTTGRKQHEEAFIGLIRKQSMAVRNKPLTGTVPALPGLIRPGSSNANSSKTTPPPPAMRVGTPANNPSKPTASPADHLTSAVTSLRSILPPLEDLPTPIDTPSTHPQLSAIKAKIATHQDEFAFIHDKVLEWDRMNRIVQKEQEIERQHRREESEARIDELFNDNEIGYADIGGLEADFKLKEAEKKYDEDQAELESFTGQIFTPVTERLQTEIADLSLAYKMALNLLDDESHSVSRCFNSNSPNPPVRTTDSMTLVLTLFNKIELRHKKLAEAHVERERRRKHLELTVLYTNGDVPAVKKLEKDFGAAEKMAVLSEARGKDGRANQLMDCFDRAAVRGLGDNQVFADEVLSKLQDLKAFITPETIETVDHPLATKEMLHLASSVLQTIQNDSRRLLALSNEADILLNESDYTVSVAEARVSNASPATYSNLEAEKAKEDTKLLEETAVRTTSVTKGPQEGIALAKRILSDLGEKAVAPADENKENEKEDWEDWEEAEARKKERLRVALEKAKARNASGSGP